MIFTFLPLVTAGGGLSRLAGLAGGNPVQRGLHKSTALCGFSPVAYNLLFIKV